MVAAGDGGRSPGGGLLTHGMRELAVRRSVIVGLHHHRLAAGVPPLEEHHHLAALDDRSLKRRGTEGGAVWFKSGFSPVSVRFQCGLSPV